MSGGLKKEFSKKEVTRMRNLVKGKTGDSVSSQVGYKKAEIDRKEGDIWTEDGREWTIKDGIRQNITKHDKAKKAHLMPLLCPECSKVMKKRNDKPFYKIHGKCFDCVIIFESKLKREGKWEQYEKDIKNKEIDNMIADFKLFIDSKKNESSQSYVTEQGDVERWVGKIDMDRIDEYERETVEYLENLKQ